jgi:hypothetical protein
MCFISGMFFVEHGFRPAIVKKGWKWAYIIFLNGSKVRCKRVLSSKIGRARPIAGSKSYSTAELAGQFLTRTTLNGKPYQLTKRCRSMLQAARS